MDILEQIKEYHEENATNIMNIFELLMLEIIECGNDFIKVSDNEYYYIRDIVELVEGL